MRSLSRYATTASLTLLLAVGAVVPVLSGCTPASTREPLTAAGRDRHDRSRERIEFETTFARWTTTLGQLRDLDLAYHLTQGAEKKRLAGQYDQKLQAAYQLENDLLVAATKAFAAAPDANRELKEFLLEVTSLLVSAECYEDALRYAELLLANQVEGERLYRMAAEAAFACSEFELAEQCWRTVARDHGLSPENRQKMEMLAAYRMEWARECRLREAERLAADLPRVVLRTERGEIELELFENEAPNTVANFVSLVERGFYDGLAFFKVVPRLAAMSGCPHGDGNGGPGHSILHECNKPELRFHFRGSVSVIPRGAVAHGSQFRITFLPTPQLDGAGTVFGRVVRGMEVLARLQRCGYDTFSEKIRPDRILSARVVRKRNHEYQPKTISDTDKGEPPIFPGKLR